VDDYEPWRRYAVSALQSEPGLLVVGEACDGSQAIRMAQELRPDLILLDIGLPLCNGIEAARQITHLVPMSKILFASENRSADIVSEALKTGALGYLFKADAGSQLLPGVNAVLEGKQFLSERVAAEPSSAKTHVPARKAQPKTCHKIDFYQEEGSLLNRVTEFVASALNAGSAVIVVATRSHRDSIVRSLRSRSVNIELAEQHGKYIAVDVAEMLSSFMVDGMPDPVRFKYEFSKRIAEMGGGREVAIFGEAVQILLERGNIEAAIAIEKLTNELGMQHPINVLCACHLPVAKDLTNADAFERICAEHSMWL